MKILLVEDDLDKSNQICEYLASAFATSFIKTCRSLQSGLQELIENHQSYLFVLLDMTLPNYELSSEEPDGGSPESFAGRNLLTQLKLRDIKIPVIVVTQYEQFGTENVPLESLSKELELEFSDNYRSTVYFSIISNSWQINLKKEIDKLLET